VIDDILPRLEKVKRTGKGNWLACCPAHEDRSPSLTIREEPDGRILVKCFAECAFEDIVNAVGLGWEPWFPPKQPEDFKPAVKRPFPAGDVLEALAAESLLVAVAACNLGNGFDLTNGDKERLILAMNRIDEGRRLALGVR
jgi:hypothetical protein